MDKWFPTVRLGRTARDLVGIVPLAVWLAAECQAARTQMDYLNPTVRALNTGILANHMMQLRAQARIAPAIESPAWLEGDGWPSSEVLACQTELVHLPSYLESATNAPRTWMRPGTPRYFCMSATAFPFDPNAGSPVRWLKFLHELWADDYESIDLLREWMGYCLTPDTRMQKILLMLGPRRAGKGTIARTLAALLGPGNVAWPNMQSLSRPFGLSGLVGKTLAVVGDAKIGGRDDAIVAAGRLVGISGEDPQEIDRKNKTSITCRLPTRLMVLANELPKLPDPSGALEGRYLAMRFTESFLGREDPDLEKALQAELPAIQLWAITGWRRLRERGRFEEPAAAAEIHEQAADVGSPVGRFVREKCNVRADAFILREELYSAFQQWCREVGRDHVPDEGEFGRLLRAAVATVTAPKNQRHVTDRNGNRCKKSVYEGIELAPAEF